MAILRLINGADIHTKLGVAEALEAIGGAGGAFVELPGEESPVHVRPESVIAVLESADRKTTGFRVVQP